MKKLILATIVAFTAIACGTGNKLVVEGTMPNSDADSTLVYLYNVEEGTPVDSVEIIDGKFKLSTDPANGVIYTLRGEGVYATILAEVGTVNVAIGEPRTPATITGAPLNTAFAAYQTEMSDIYKGASEQYRALIEAEDTEGADSLISGVEAQVAKRTDELLEANATNAFGTFLIMQKIGSGDYNLEEFDALVAKGGELAQNFKNIKESRTSLVNYDATDVGKMFADFEGVKPTGEAVKLSDYVGKGNYVLADFWGSWCGPCRRAMPSLVEINKEYKDKGLVVLGINVWDNKEGFEKAVEELGIVWDNICVFDSNIATETYGIKGIPHIMLFDPEGKVVERELHGERLNELIAEIYKK